MEQVFNGQSADGNSTNFKHLGNSKALNIYVAGDLGGGTVTVQAQTPDESGWIMVAGGEFTAAGMHSVFSAPFVGRLVLSGSAGASVDAYIESDNGASQDRVFNA